MGKVKRCAFGRISGSIGPITFADRGGQQIVYMKPDPSKMTRTSVKVKNVNTLDFLISCLYNQLFKKHLRKYWDIKKLARKGQNLLSVLMKENCGSLYSTIKDKNTPLGTQNWVNMQLLNLTFGHRLIEPIHITSLNYQENKPSDIEPQPDSQTPVYRTGQLEVKWDTSSFIGGKPDDIANIVAIYCQPKDSVVIQNRFTLKTYYTTGIRKDGYAVLETDFYEDPKHFTVFLFFNNIQHYSHSIGLNYGNKMPHAR